MEKENFYDHVEDDEEEDRGENNDIYWSYK